MKIKPLIETNPYLKDPQKREELIARSVRTSSGVEGISATGRIKSAHIEIIRRNNKKIYDKIKRSVTTK